MTIEEYLAFENASSEKHEYYRGEVFAMSGGKINHNRIAGNTFSGINQLLIGKSCTSYNSDQRVYVEKALYLPILTFLFSATESIPGTMIK